MDAITNDYVANTAGGTPYLAPSFGTGVAGVIDFTKPSAVAWWQGRIRAGLDLGADGFMQDFGEQVQGPMVFADGSTGSQTHNRFPILYHRATRAVVDDYQSTHAGREIFFFTRAGFSGTADEASSIAWDSANFLGDETTDYSRTSGLASQITDMLNRGLGGAYGATTDIGGYEDIISGTTTKELLIRWSELAALSPFYRLHNSADAGTQMPWAFDQQTVDLYNAYAALHIRAVPLIQSLWRAALAGGPPLLRPLWMQYPGDATTAAQDQEFLLGPDVLVAPVVTQGATSRAVYLPAGCWQRRGVDGSAMDAPITGGVSVTAAAALGELP